MISATRPLGGKPMSKIFNIKKQGSFYVGSFPDRRYVQFQVPARLRHPEPLIMIPGGAHTGACYESTPDGRKGWKDYFLRKGFRVYVVDWPGTGRSGHHPHFYELTGEDLADLLVQLLEKIKPICPAILITHSMSGAYGWKVAEKVPRLISKIVALAPAAPGNMMKESRERFSGLIKAPIIIDKDEAKRMWANADCFSQDHFEDYYNSLAALSPRLANERVNYNQAQLTIAPASLKGIKILVITGETDPRHPQEIDKSIVDYFWSYGIDARHYYLPHFGLWGNGHLLMLEKNNLEIVKLIYSWIKKSG